MTDTPTSPGIKAIETQLIIAEQNPATEERNLHIAALKKDLSILKAAHSKDPTND